FESRLIGDRAHDVAGLHAMHMAHLHPVSLVRDIACIIPPTLTTRRCLGRPLPHVLALRTIARPAGERISVPSPMFAALGRALMPLPRIQLAPAMLLRAVCRVTVPPSRSVELAPHPSARLTLLPTSPAVAVSLGSRGSARRVFLRLLGQQQWRATL